MKIGVPLEIKEQESRVGLTPGSVKELTTHGHSVIIESNAGCGAGFENSAYKNVGAKINTKSGSIAIMASISILNASPTLGIVSVSGG